MKTENAHGRRQGARTKDQFDERDEILSTELGEERRGEKKNRRKKHKRSCDRTNPNVQCAMSD
jgi:hypothetical protein